MSLPENIDVTSPEKHMLTLRVQRDSLAFTIYEKNKPDSFCFRKIQFSDNLDFLGNIEQIIFDNSYLSYSYKSVNVIYVTTGYELVPDYLFEKKYMQQLYKFTHFCDGNEIALRNNVSVQENELLFGIDEEVHKFLVRNLINPIFYHHSGILIPYLFEKTRTANSKSQMFLNFHGNTTDILCFTEGRIANAISYTDLPDSDIIYFALALWEKSGFDQLKDQLFLFSGKENIATINSTLSKYVKYVSLFGLSSDVQFLPEEAKKTPLDLLAFSV